MEHRQLGRSDLRVPTLCIGSNVFGWTADEAMSFRVLDTFAEAGLTFIDTADIYAPAWDAVGHNEQIVADAPGHLAPLDAAGGGAGGAGAGVPGRRRSGAGAAGAASPYFRTPHRRGAGSPERGAAR